MMRARTSNRRWARLAATMLALAGGAGAGPLPAAAQGADKVVIATAGRAIFNYIPVTIAERLGAFKDEGLDVTVNDFAGGQKTVEALVGGSVEMAVTSYDNTIMLQQKGIALVDVGLINRSIGAVIAISAAKAASVKGPRDVKGLQFGVSSPGSATHRILNLYLAKGGLAASDVSVHGLGGGAGAVAMLGSGRIDAFVHAEPVVSQVMKSGQWKLEVDLRTEAGMTFIYGGYIAATCLLTTPRFIEQRPQTVQRMVRALVRTLRFMQETPPDKILEKIPAEYYGPDRDTYRDALAQQIPIFSGDGILGTDIAKRTYEGMVREGVLKADATIDLARTIDNRFAEAAARK